MGAVRLANPKGITISGNFPVEDMCDNGGWNQGGINPPSKPQRRIIGTIEATDPSGMNWSSCGHYLQPDPKTDPPELQLYRIRPSLIPGTESTRVWAHILQASQVLQCSGSCCSLQPFLTFACDCSQYAPSFDSVHLSNSSYGHQPPACSSDGPHLPDGRLRCCHGPHLGEYLATLVRPASKLRPSCPTLP